MSSGGPLIDVFYRDAHDGWRVGQLEGFRNEGACTVVDRATGLVNTVRPHDVIDLHPPTRHPPNAAAAHDAATEADEHNAAPPPGPAHASVTAINNITRLLHMSGDPQYVDREDLARMVPTPLSHMASVVECLRVRYDHGVHVSYLGDDVAVEIVEPPGGEAAAYTAGPPRRHVAAGASSEASSSPSTSAACTLGPRIIEAAEATSRPQCVVTFDDTSSVAVAGDVAAAIIENIHINSMLRADGAATKQPNSSSSFPPPESARGSSLFSPRAASAAVLAADAPLPYLQRQGRLVQRALELLTPFTHDFTGKCFASHVIRLQTERKLASESLELRASRIDVSMLDMSLLCRGRASHAVPPPQLSELPSAGGLGGGGGSSVAPPSGNNFSILGHIAFAVPPDDRERWYFPRKAATPEARLACANLDWVVPAGQDDANASTMLRHATAMSPSFDPRAQLLERLRLQYYETVRLFSDFQLDTHAQMTIFGRVAAVVHLLTIEFNDDDGSPRNLSAMRSAAKLIGCDFNALSKVLSSKAHCEAIACLLYSGVVRLILRYVNAALDPTGAILPLDAVAATSEVPPTSGRLPEGESQSPTSLPPVVITILAATSPCCLAGSPLMPHGLFRNLLAEECVQAVVRAFELDAHEGQRMQGFVVPRSAQVACQNADNVESLRLCRAKGGVLHAIELACGAYSAQVHREGEPFARDYELSQRVLNGLSKKRSVKYDAKGQAVAVPHSFGTASYQMPPLPKLQPDGSLDANLSTAGSAEAATWLTFMAPCFSEAREFVLSCADVETQEAMYLEIQASAPPVDGASSGDGESSSATSSNATNVMRRLRGELDTIVTQVLQREATVLWSLHRIELPEGGGFRGAFVEDALVLRRVAACTQLRQALPRRLLAVPYDHIVATFAKLIQRSAAHQPSAGGAAADPDDVRKRAEEIVGSASLAGQVGALPGATKLLVDGAGLVRLRRALRDATACSVIKVQNCLRSIHSALVALALHVAVERAVQQEQAEREAILRWQRERIRGAQDTRDALLQLQERESSDRRSIAEAAWIDVVAMETAQQDAHDTIISDAIARSIAEQKKEQRVALRQSQKRSLEGITARIQERLIAQGKRFDAVVRKELSGSANSVERLSKMQRVHERFMAIKAHRDDQKLMVEAQLEAKKQRLEQVLMTREAQREKIRQSIWEHQERGRAVREQTQLNREAMELHAQENLTMRDIELELTQRIQEELREKQRKQREALAQRHEKAKAEMSQDLEMRNKRSFRRSVRQELATQADSDRARAASLRRSQLLWEAQERERRAAEQAKRYEERRRKTLTRNLLKAHTLLHDPLVFEHAASGQATRLRSSSVHSKTTVGGKSAASRGWSEGFVMTNGRRTYAPVLPAEVWDGVIQFHDQSRRREALDSSLDRRSRGPTSVTGSQTRAVQASATPPSAASPAFKAGASKWAASARLRSASPRSVFSL